MKRNYFEQSIPSFGEIVRSRQIRDYLMKQMHLVFKEMGMQQSHEIIENVFRLAESCGSGMAYERHAHELMVSHGITSMFVSEKLGDRATLIYSQIKDFFKGKRILDLGCGDGKVGELISKQGYHVTLADVYEHPYISRTGLRFVEFEQGDSVAATEKFDTTLLLTVLHHSSVPIETFAEARRLTSKNGRIIVIESVYGVNEKQDVSNLFGKLSYEQQRYVNIFLDHFYNRVIHYSKDPANKVNVPFNFCTPIQWKEIFEKHATVQEEEIHLGIDQPLVPEYHTLHVLRVN